MQVHVPVRALPGRDVRQGHARHHLRQRARRAARQPPQGHRPARRRASATASTATSACRYARPASTSAMACSTSASAAPRASTGATRSWTRWATRRASSATRRRTRWPRATTRRRHRGGACCGRAPSIYAAVLLAIAGAAAVSLATAQSAQGRRPARPRRARARSVAGRDRERLPRADHEHRRSRAAVHAFARDGFPGLEVVGVEQPVDLGPAHRACSRCACARRRPTTRPRSPGRSRIRSSSSCKPSATTRWCAMRSPRSSSPGSKSPPGGGAWYREPWPWILIAGPLVGRDRRAWPRRVIAVRSDDGMVADDYYKRGLLVNQRCRRTGWSRRIMPPRSRSARAARSTCIPRQAIRGAISCA